MKLDHQFIGWREWVTLPELGISAVKAKVDTGARTSALHAFAIESFRENGKDRVRFAIHPFQRNFEKELICTADILDVRTVTDSGGHAEDRYVIQTPIQLGDRCWPIEITLTNRDSMVFRMLLGRTALTHGFYIDPLKSYLLGKKFKKT